MNMILQEYQFFELLLPRRLLYEDLPVLPIFQSSRAFESCLNGL